MAREGRAQPIQPFAAHGFLGNTPANGVLPLETVVVVPLADERARQRPTPTAVVVRGAFASTQAVFPPEPVVVRADDRRRDTPVPQATHGVDDVRAPQPDLVEHENRRRRATPDPVAISGVLATTGAAPTVVPPGPFVVPVDERRRLLAAAPPETRRGFDDTQPPRPTVVPPEDRSRRPQGGGEISAGIPTPEQANPPAPFVVPLDERRRILERLQQPQTGRHGFVGNQPPNGVLPPRPSNLDRADQRARYLPLPPTVSIAGVMAATVPAAPVTVNAGTDWAAEMSTW